MSDLIAIDDLRVFARGRLLLRVEELCVERGEVLGVLGPNGAGKSTLLRVCAGCQRYTGRVRVLGEDIAALGWLRATSLRRRIGYLPQASSPGGEMPLTVREVVAIGRSGIRGAFLPLQREDWRIVDAWIERLDLTEAAGRPYAETSGGQQRKALLARAMVQEPELLLLDEPAAHLDLGTREQVVRAIDDLHRQTGIAVVLVCHEVEVLPPGCGRVVLLDQGEVRGVGPLDDVLTDARIQTLYGEGLGIINRGGRRAVVPTGAAS